MKTRGTRGGIVLILDAQDDLTALEEKIRAHQGLFSGKVFLELAGRMAWPLVERIGKVISELGGTVAELRPAGASAPAPPPAGETVVVTKTLRSGSRVEASGALVVMGDVNAGAEVIAGGDIIVLGQLRGLAHAGAGGNERAIIWAQHILSPQLRIAGFLAQAGTKVQAGTGPEFASVREGQIVLTPWDR